MTGLSRRGLVAGVAALALLAGCSSGARHPGPSTPAAARAPDRAASGVDAARSFQPVCNYRATPVPVRIEIPRIRATSSLERLGREADGTIETPTRGRWPAGTRSARDQATPGRR